VGLLTKYLSEKWAIRAPFGAGICVFLLAVTPALSQSPDPFQSNPGPAPAPAPRPRPPPRAEPDAVVAAPPATPSLAPPVVAAPKLPPSSEIEARVRQVGLAQNIGVPLAEPIVIDVAGTPPACQPLLGAWGPAAWTAKTQNRVILIVLKFNAAGLGRVIYASGAGPDFQPNWQYCNARASGQRFVFSTLPSKPTNPPNLHEYNLQSDGNLHGTRNNDSTITLPPLR